jgi:pyruvate ferredoxin oxidoreductase delta subunit
MYCPDAVIDEEYNIDLFYCKGCGICANECPKNAIEMIREESES